LLKVAIFVGRCQARGDFKAGMLGHELPPWSVSAVLS
jgi:hypothetical protein